MVAEERHGKERKERDIDSKGGTDRERENERGEEEAREGIKERVTQREKGGEKKSGELIWRKKPTKERRR